MSRRAQMRQHRTTRDRAGEPGSQTETSAASAHPSSRRSCRRGGPHCLQRRCSWRPREDRRVSGIFASSRLLMSAICRRTFGDLPCRLRLSSLRRSSRLPKPPHSTRRSFRGISALPSSARIFLNATGANLRMASASGHRPDRRSCRTIHQRTLRRSGMLPGSADRGRRRIGIARRRR